MVEMQKILSKEGIKDFEKDIRTMTKKEISKHFSFKSSKSINLTLLVKNLIWQTYTWIKEGKMKPIEGNIRSFWYRSVKSVLSRLGYDVHSTKYIEKVYDTFIEMIVEHRLFRYMDMGFLDTRIYHRTVGKKNGNLILFMEKEGLFSPARQVAIENDATAIASKGYPSYLTLEFFLSDMAKHGLLHEPVHVFSVVDYDPSGYWIHKEFLQQLKQYDVEIGSSQLVIDPKTLPQKTIEMYKYKLKAGAKTNNWMELTGGVKGETYGIEADAFESNEIKQAYQRAIEPHLKKQRAKLKARRVEKGREDFFKSLAAARVYLPDGLHLV